MNEQIIVMVGMLLNFTLGYWVSKNAKAGAVIRKLIPTGNFVVSLLTQIIASANAAAPPEVAAPAVMTAGFFGTFGKGFLDIFVNSLIQTFVVTGAHSATKNTRQAFSK